MRENKIYVSLYLFWSKFIFIEFIPYTTILIMNIFIIIKITKSARFRKKFQTRQEENDAENQQLDIIEEEDAEVNEEDPEVYHIVWKWLKMSHLNFRNSTLQAKRAAFTFWVDKSSIKNQK